MTGNRMVLLKFTQGATTTRIEPAHDEREARKRGEELLLNRCTESGQRHRFDYYEATPYENGKAFFLALEVYDAKRRRWLAVDAWAEVCIIRL